jgi:hypothetical protein
MDLAQTILSNLYLRAASSAVFRVLRSSGRPAGKNSEAVASSKSQSVIGASSACANFVGIYPASFLAKALS